MTFILRYFTEFCIAPGRTAKMSSQKFTFAISYPDEFLVYIHVVATEECGVSNGTVINDFKGRLSYMKPF